MLLTFTDAILHQDSYSSETPSSQNTVTINTVADSLQTIHEGLLN